MGRVLGLNARNAHIARENSRSAIVRSKDKLATKQRLSDAGVAVPPTLLTVCTRREARHLPASRLPDQWVMKPANGSRGRGVL